VTGIVGFTATISKISGVKFGVNPFSNTCMLPHADFVALFKFWRFARRSLPLLINLFQSVSISRSDVSWLHADGAMFSSIVNRDQFRKDVNPLVSAAEREFIEQQSSNAAIESLGQTRL